MADYLSVFRSPFGQEQVYSAYDKIMECWPVPYQELYLPTRLGSTHIIVSGPEKAPPLLLIPAFCASAVSWYRNIADLSNEHRVYCVDTIGDPNKSRPFGYIRRLSDYHNWFNDMLDELNIKRANFIGNSIGAFHVANFALHEPQKVRSMVLIGPAATFQQIMRFYLNTFPGGITGWDLLVNHAVDWTENGIPFDPLWRNLFYLTLRHGKPANQVFPLVFKDEQLQQIHTPTLLLFGDKEVIYDINTAILRAKKLMPELEVEIIQRGNHITALSQPEITNSTVLSFLRKY